MRFERSFFEAEEREGFLVSEMMKRAWAAALEVYEVVMDLASRHGINVYACGGTLLGAIRHKGFIPWDDDIDVCIIRDEYMRFIEIAKKELPEGFVVAGMYADEKRLFMANETMQLRVIADENYFSLPSYMNRFHGYPYPRIGIDIFPYDMGDGNVNAAYYNHRIYHFCHYIMRNYDALKKNGSLIQLVRELEETEGVKIDLSDDELAKQKIVLLGDKHGSYVERGSGILLSNITDRTYPNGFPEKSDYKSIAKSGVPIEWYGDGVYLPFESTKIKVGKEYLKIVEATFGPDYMTPVMFTAEHEYPFYKNQEAEFRRMLDDSGINISIEEFCKNWHIANGGE